MDQYKNKESIISKKSSILDDDNFMKSKGRFTPTDLDNIKHTVQHNNKMTKPKQMKVEVKTKR